MSSLLFHKNECLLYSSISKHISVLLIRSHLSALRCVDPPSLGDPGLVTHNWTQGLVTVATRIQYSCQVGWSDFENNFFFTFYVVPNCCRSPIQKSHILILLTCRRASENVDCYSKIRTFLFETLLKPATGASVFFDF